MRDNYTGIIPVIIGLLLTVSTTSIAQVPDDIDGRLWRLCKVWGYAKYYHENNCSVNWNDVLLKAIDSILVSTSNASFNQSIAELLNSAGPVSHATDSLVIEADININAHFDWMEDPKFSQEVRDSLDSILINFRPKENCLVKFNDYTDPNFGGWVSFSNDNILSIPSFSYTHETDRLLAFFYYWNIINYFHPDKDLMDQDWDTTLYQFIPLFREVKNDQEFHIRFLNLVKYIDDSHGSAISQITSSFFGSHFPLLAVSFIEGQTVISGIGTGITGIKVGDIITKIDGVDITTVRDALVEYTPASNYNVLQRSINQDILGGQFGSNLSLELKDDQGATYARTIKRLYTFSTYYNWITEPKYPVWEITECGYGYINMGELLSYQVPQMYDDLKEAPAIIFDVRNYPNGTILALIPHLFPGPIAWALFTVPDLTYPGWYYWTDNLEQSGTFTNPDPYDGKVIILADATTQSHAEYTVMGLQQHPNAFTIGSQTAGADGNISSITLPGSLSTRWTSLGIYYPDSLTAQRVGVRIDSIVTPTIQGIRNGEDEVLEAALDCLTSVQNEASNNPSIDIYPIPADDHLSVSVDLFHANNGNIKVFDMLGHLMFQHSCQSGETQDIPIDVTQWVNGIYIVTLRDESGVTANRKVLVQH